MESDRMFCVKFRVKELFSGLFFVMIFSFPAFGFFGGKVESLSADMVVIAADGNVISTSKLYITMVTTSVDMMGMKITSTETIWQSDQFDMPLRIHYEEGVIMEYRNIDTKKPSSKLFELPNGYKKVGNIMEVMGMDFSGMDMHNATLGSKSSFQDVCDFYESNLKAKGWQNSGSHIQDGQGFLQLTKEEQHLMISSADNPLTVTVLSKDLK